MGKVSRKEFAIIADCSVNTIHTYVGRDKVIVGDDKLIDTEHVINKHFIKMRKLNKGMKTNFNAAKGDERQSVQKTTKRRKRKKDESQLDEITRWSVRKEKANAVKAELDTELKKLQLEKMMGQLIPVDLMRGILKINIQNIFMSFENELVNIASIYCDILAGGDRKRLAQITDEMRVHLSRIIKETKKNTAKEIKGVVIEYSETRSRGQRN